VSLKTKKEVHMPKNIFKLFILTSILSGSILAAQPPKNIISKQKAEDIAMKTAPGSVKSSELEFENKQWVYSFDILGRDNQIHEVQINAKTGNLVENKIESAAQEKKELKEDANEHQKH
jgi:uncharacterized membrane protein YkoI